MSISSVFDGLSKILFSSLNYFSGTESDRGEDYSAGAVITAAALGALTYICVKRITTSPRSYTPQERVARVPARDQSPILTGRGLQSPGSNIPQQQGALEVKESDDLELHVGEPLGEEEIGESDESNLEEKKIESKVDPLEIRFHRFPKSNEIVGLDGSWLEEKKGGIKEEQNQTMPSKQHISASYCLGCDILSEAGLLNEKTEAALKTADAPCYLAFCIRYLNRDGYLTDGMLDVFIANGEASHELAWGFLHCCDAGILTEENQKTLVDNGKCADILGRLFVLLYRNQLLNNERITAVLNCVENIESLLDGLIQLDRANLLTEHNFQLLFDFENGEPVETILLTERNFKALFPNPNESSFVFPQRTLPNPLTQEAFCEFVRLFKEAKWSPASVSTTRFLSDLCSLNTHQ